jgi:transcriptional regulator with XRE-family HTH domain
MPESYGWDIIEAAEEMYILDGLTFDQVAERTGVSVSQLKRWSGDSNPSWPDRRKEYRAAQVSVRRGVMLAKAKVIASVIESEDPQKAYAFGALVSAGKQIEAEARERMATSGPASAPVDAAAGPLPDGGDMVEALRLAVQARIAALTQQPGAISLKAIQELLAAMDMLERKTAASAEEPEAIGGLSDDAAEIIRRKILGLKS